MSNTEEHPDEFVLGNENDAETPATELLEPREVPLGGARAMPVLRALPNKNRRMIGAWCFIDSYGPVELSTHGGMQVPPHPHIGLQTVSWLVAGDVQHRDSLGTSLRIEPGTLGIMTAGHGISHSEMSPEDAPPTLHGAQLWVALPENSRTQAPSFAGLTSLPTFELESNPAGRATATLLVGDFEGQSSDAPAFTPLFGLEVKFAGTSSANVTLHESFEHGVLALTDDATVNGEAVARGSVLYLAPGHSSVTLSTSGPGTLMILGGEPFAEEIVMFWNFVGRTHDEVEEARDTWQTEREAELSSDARPRFGLVPDHEGFTLPAPRLPSVELLPRGRARRRKR
ncbi:pirin family protein [Humidisolicoccus flavus]|uniref:pirin family protein n=1 Tax=Humidisolicoccus flavus TaxID=3111414 RepID=UPI003250F92F